MARLCVSAAFRLLVVRLLLLMWLLQHPGTDSVPFSDGEQFGLALTGLLLRHVHNLIIEVVCECPQLPVALPGLYDDLCQLQPG